MRPIQIVVLLATASMLIASPLQAAGRGSQSEAQATYNKDRAACLRGEGGQDRATCLKEAGAAYEEARRGRLDDGRVQYQQNALLRCAVLPPEERGACHARMQGRGTTSGSVEGGGIYRELVTRETAPPAADPLPETGAK